MKGILLSLGILIPTILPSQIRLVPFLGNLFSIVIENFKIDMNEMFSSPFSRTFFQWGYLKMERMSRESFRPLSREPFFNPQTQATMRDTRFRFRPLSRGPFFNNDLIFDLLDDDRVFVPFLGDFFSIACLRSPSPSALASAFAAGMGGSLHQALSFGDEMPIFPGRAGIGGDLQ